MYSKIDPKYEILTKLAGKGTKFDPLFYWQSQSDGIGLLIVKNEFLF